MKKIIYNLFIILANYSYFNAQSWSIVNSGTTNNLNKVAFANENIAVIAGLNGTCLRTADAGITWSTTNAPTNVSYYDVKFINENIGFLGGAFGKLYKTSDGGLTWILKNTGTFGDVVSIAPTSDGQTIYAVIYDFSTEIVKSTDAGETWQILASPTPTKIQSVSFLTPQIGYLVGDLNLVYKTTNGGSTWALQSVPYSDVSAFFSISILDENTAFTCGGNQRIMKTGNGSTWTSVNSNLANFYRCTKFITPNVGYVVGGNGRIIFTNNAGSSYTSQATGTSNTLFGIDVSATGSAIAVGEEGMILRKDAPAPNTAPTAQDDVASTAFNTPVTVNVLANDTDAEGNINPSSVTVTVPSPNGTTSVNTTTGAITFTPTSGFSGNTTFTYQVCDNALIPLCATAVVTITVGVNSIEENTILTAVYPNPVNSVLTIESKEQVKSLRVISLDGKEMLHVKNAKTINVEQLAKGIYTLEITFEGNSVSRKEFVKD
jgi:photosystem II stability/assembly factor-like uncharacterized protein